MGRAIHKIICAFLIFVTLAATPASTMPGCPATLELIQQNLDARIEGMWWWKRNRLKRKLDALKPEIERELAAACPNFSTCSLDARIEAVAQAVDSVIDSPQVKGPSKSAYALFLGTITVNAVISTILVKTFDPTTATLTASLIAGISGVLVNSLGSPITQRLQSLTEGWSWKKRRAKGQLGERNPRETEYETTAIRSRENLTPMAQAGRGVNRGALATALAILTSCTQVWLMDKAKGPDMAAQMLARVIVDLMKSYGEVDLSREEFADYARDVFSRHFLTAENFHGFIDKTMNQVEARVPAGTDIRPYARVLLYWLSPGAITGSPDNRLSLVEPPSPSAVTP